MSAADLLARAEAAGVTVEADRGWLRLTAAAPASTRLMHDLAGAKAEVLALLECRADEAAESAAIRAEPALPPPGTKKRATVDQAQRATLAGLMAAAFTETQYKTEGKS